MANIKSCLKTILRKQFFGFDLNKIFIEKLEEQFLELK